MDTSSEYVEDPNLVGAVVYMAPEFFDEDEPVYKKDVDVWAFGCVAYELFHLKRLFPGSKIAIQVRNVCNDKRESFSDDFPVELQQLIVDCTKKNPKERLPISDVVNRITKIKDSIGNLNG